MSIATTALRYGWKVLAILTIGTGSIFVADNVLNRITTKDRIEVTLAVVERCMATQTGTNPATYGVDPPSIVRTWTDTNGASVTMTNAIAWRDDLSMKVELDAKLEALCPYYVDTNSVYDGTTNIVMHTFTGLLTSLDLGDHTNFTAIPAIGTNIATYGPWAWRNYIVAWQERYKVLEAMKYNTSATISWSSSNETENIYPSNSAYALASGDPNWPYNPPTVSWDFENGWDIIKNVCISNGVFYGGGTDIPRRYTIGRHRHYIPYLPDAWNVWFYYEYYYPKITVALVPTNFLVDCTLFVYATSLEATEWIWDSEFTSNQWHVAEVFHNITNGTFYGSKIGNNDIDFNFASDPTTTNYAPYSKSCGKGYQISGKMALLNWQFNYCTNAYWE